VAVAHPVRLWALLLGSSNSRALSLALGWALVAAAACHTAVYGNFSGPKAQEIMVSRGKLLELLRPDDAGKLQTVLSVEVFGQIRSLAAFRLTGASKVQPHPPS
jgi:hypothetical protein